MPTGTGTGLFRDPSVFSYGYNGFLVGSGTGLFASPTAGPFSGPTFASPKLSSSGKLVEIGYGLAHLPFFYQHGRFDRLRCYATFVVSDAALAECRFESLWTVAAGTYATTMTVKTTLPSLLMVATLEGTFTGTGLATIKAHDGHILYAVASGLEHVSW